MHKRLLPLLLALLALPAAGEETRFWRQNSYGSFEKGTPSGVALRSDGEILLAPRYREVADPNLEFLWAIAEDESGNLYVGGGSPAKVVKIDPSGNTTVVFESKELGVNAVVVDRESGALYAATSPDGSVYQIPPSGQARVLFNPERKYLWDLARHPDGTLYLATGDKGEIFRIGPEGKGEVFFSSKETHVRVLALDGKGYLYAGTEPNGLVLRVSPQGEAFVLYEMPRKEVTALRFDPAGNLYVAAIGQKVQLPGVPGLVPTPGVPAQQVGAAQPGVVVTATAATISAPGMVAAPRFPFPTAGGSDIYRIAPDGYPEGLWSSETELVYSLALDAQSRLLVGTGNEGKLLAIESPNLVTYVRKSGSQQITSLLATDKGRVYVGTANPGKVSALGPELEAEGSFESEVFDAGLFSQWGRIRWRSRSQAGKDTVELFTRTGNTSDPKKNWSPWSAAYATPEGSPISSPAARFVQWQAVMRARDSHTPSLSEVSVAYLRRNVAPVVDTIIVQAPAISVRSLPKGLQPNQPAQLELPPPTGSQARGVPAPPQQQAGQRIEPPPQGTTEPGARSVLWSAFDENEDELTFSVFYRGEGETRWKPMAKELTDKFYTWDAATLPDGAYYIKVVASDAPGNPPQRALTGENSSDRFEVDNTPPRVDELRAAKKSPTVEIRFVARDSYSSLKRAQYSVDAGEWETVFPLSGTTDAREHHYQFQLEKLEPGEHTVVVRVYDRFDNPALAKTTFVVP